MAPLLRFSLFAFIIVASAALSGCSVEEAKLGTESNPIKLYFTPSNDEKSILKGSEEMIKFLERQTEYKFKSVVPSDYTTVVECLGSGRADIAFINSFGYVLANQKYGVEPKLKIIRNGTDKYKGQIIVHIDSDIENLEDLDGKHIAYTDPSSASGYLFPAKMMKEANIKPSQTVFANRHDKVVSMVYTRQVDAGATYYTAPTRNGMIRDARQQIVNEYPDVAEKVKIIALTENIPNDPVVFRKDIPENMKMKVVDALRAYVNTPGGRQTFKELYNIEGFTPAHNRDYDGLRNMMKVNEIQPESVVK